MLISTGHEESNLDNVAVSFQFTKICLLEKKTAEHNIERGNGVGKVRYISLG